MTAQASPASRQSSTRDDVQFAPAEGQEGDRRIAYAEYGVETGSPVVFLHGTPGSRRLAELFEPAARDSGVRLLAPDRPGYGRSDPWPGRSIRDGEPIVRAVLDHAGIDAARLVAFSGGAPYAFAAAAGMPARVNRVDAVAGATPPEYVHEPPAVQRVLSGVGSTAPPVLAALLRAQRWVAARRDPSFVVAQYTTGDPTAAVSDRAAEVVRGDFLEALARHRSGAVAEFRQTAAEWDVDFGDIDAPVRLWHGDDDENVPIAAVRRFEAALPTARLEVLDGADHLGTLLRSVPATLGD
ncbi:alpha/beta hydrolase fold protein [Halorubrum saccharovorum DSM 1137]|uniref:Alpha/beta hydrolase fold protein n=1 Tax=Halorubrum saccharovorum DSM 1137 TaxID=1227484 RepID=M0E698_9EURY|nr:alpha/beta hydrolase [Halorubrum saccharovorum]ELZ42447.1 alpha/beta hydrolase fold protein [Halorubrum saccharovorum DSM 1137]